MNKWREIWDCDTNQFKNWVNDLTNMDSEKVIFY